MKTIVKATTITAFFAATFTGAVNANTYAAPADDVKKISTIAAEEIQAQDWASAEEELLKTDFGSEDQVFATLNMAYLYSITGRTDRAEALYQEVLDGRDNRFAMTLSGKPRKVKYIARDGLKRLRQ